MSTNFSITTASKTILKAGAQLVCLLVIVATVNELIFYILLNVYPGRGDYALETLKTAGERKRFFLGSSRTLNAVSATRFDEACNAPGASFNLGFGGYSLIDQYLLLENIFAAGRHPEEIVVEMSTPSFNSDINPILLTGAIPYALGLSLPAAEKYTYVKEIINSRFHLLLRHFHNDPLLQHKLSMQGDDPIHSLTSFHYAPETRYKKPGTTVSSEYTKSLTGLTQRVLDRIIQRCKEAGVHLRIILPVQLTDQELTVLLPVWDRLSPDTRWNTENDSLWTPLRNGNYWYDFLHPNSEGSKLYTRILNNTYR